MCLYSNVIQTSVADEDIKCYKILDKKKGLKTPFQRYEISEEIINGDENLKACYADETIDNTPKKDNDLGYLIKDGFIHSINGEEESKHVFGVIKRLFSDYIKHPVLFECIIPKGTEYYSGRDNNYHHGFASKELKFVKQIEVEEQEEKENGVQ